MSLNIQILYLRRNFIMMTLAESFRELVSTDKTLKKDIRLCDEATFDVQYPTGFICIDYGIGQQILVDSPEKNLKYKYDAIGIVDGSINMAVARSGGGKTTMFTQMSGNIIRNFPTSSVFIDSVEGGITHRRLETLLNMTPQETHRRAHVRQNVTQEAFFKKIKVLHDWKLAHREELEYKCDELDSMGNPIYKLEPTVYILDSLAVLAPEKLHEEDDLSGQMATTASAKQLARIFRMLIVLCKEANIILFVINHITDDVQIGMVHKQSDNIYLKQGEKTPGGKTPFYLSNMVFRLDDNTKLKENEGLGIHGNLVDVSMIKSRTSGANTIKIGTLVLDPIRGFNPILSLFVNLKDAGFVEGAGAFLYIKGHPEIKFAQKNFEKKMIENPEFVDIVMSAAVEHYSKQLSVRSFKGLAFDELGFYAKLREKLTSPNYNFEDIEDDNAIEECLLSDDEA